MKRNLSGICAAALSASLVLSTAAPLAAAPVWTGNPPIGNDIIRVQMDPNPMVRPETVRPDSGVRIAQRDWRRDRRDHRGGRDFHRRGNNYYFNGHRGYRHHRPGYREFNGWWFPAAAFIAGAIISGSANQGRVVRGGSAHVQWCYDRYRSYRASDNTFQPYNGPRQHCYSPYN
jgi:hypothetical protein